MMVTEFKFLSSNPKLRPKPPLHGTEALKVGDRFVGALRCFYTPTIPRVHLGEVHLIHHTHIYNNTSEFIIIYHNILNPKP